MKTLPWRAPFRLGMSNPISPEDGMRRILALALFLALTMFAAQAVLPEIHVLPSARVTHG